ncbi:MAG: hypothetical protein AAGF92_22065 [Myxococcota bacterium]
MRKYALYALIIGAGVGLFGAPGATLADDPDPRTLVEKVVKEAGGANALRDRNDVQYTYIYRSGESGALDVSVERYLFDGEYSWARYDVHEGRMFGGAVGPVVQGYDGRNTWQTDNGVATEKPQALKMADFLRKTNFYWFAMTFKLLDPGMTYAYEGTRKVGDTTYELVRVGFNQGVGDVADTYLLYINPNTWRVDQFLFTVLDFGMKEPLMMKVDYERVDGVLLATKRRYAPAKWSGKVSSKAKWTDEISVNVEFDNGFKKSMFEGP